jgi:hypothetical protein
MKPGRQLLAIGVAALLGAPLLGLAATHPVSAATPDLGASVVSLTRGGI